MKAATVNNKAAQVEAAIEKADINSQQKEAEKNKPPPQTIVKRKKLGSKRSMKKKKKIAQDALEAKEVTPNQGLQRLVAAAL